VTVVGGKPTSPSSGSDFSYYTQPVTLTIKTGVATGGAAPTTTIEVATDAAFATIVNTQNVTADASGQASVTLDHLSPATTYYWRLKTTAGSNPGVYSSASSFSIGPLLVIQAPAPVQPLANSFPHKRPTFIVANAARTGPAGAITYRFDIATDAAFNTIVTTGTVPEAATQTVFAPTVDLTPGTTYFWRAQASDVPKNVTGPYSASQTFTTVFPEDGSFPYTLAVHAPTYCLTNNTQNNGCGGGPRAWDLSDYTFNGTLSVTTDDMQFSSQGSGSTFDHIGRPIAFGFGRLNNRLSGTVSGDVNYALPNPAVVYNSVLLQGTVMGDSDNAGHFKGTFDGKVGMHREGFPCYNDLVCSTSGFTWTLTPR